jgi:hypothetical protein
MVRAPSLTLHVEDFHRNQNADNGRHAVFYVVVASMSLFINILVHPKSEQAATDLEWLALAFKTVSKLSTRHSGDEVKHSQQAKGFVGELWKLANAAISKADGG